MPHLDLPSGASRPKAHPGRLQTRLPGLLASFPITNSPDRDASRSELADGASSSTSFRASWPGGLLGRRGIRR